MSALLPKADICSALTHVRFVPQADIGFVYDTWTAIIELEERRVWRRDLSELHEPIGEALAWAPAHIFPGVLLAMALQLTIPSAEQRTILVFAGLTTPLTRSTSPRLRSVPKMASWARSHIAVTPATISWPAAISTAPIPLSTNPHTSIAKYGIAGLSNFSVRTILIGHL